MEEPIPLNKTIDFKKFFEGIQSSGVINILSNLTQNCIVDVESADKKIYSEKDVKPVMDKVTELLNNYLKTQNAFLATGAYLIKYQEITEKIIDMNEENTQEFKRLYEESNLKELSTNLQTEIKKIY